MLSVPSSSPLIHSLALKTWAPQQQCNEIHFMEKEIKDSSTHRGLQFTHQAPGLHTTFSCKPLSTPHPTLLPCYRGTLDKHPWDMGLVPQSWSSQRPLENSTGVRMQCLDLPRFLPSWYLFLPLSHSHPMHLPRHPVPLLSWRSSSSAHCLKHSHFALSFPPSPPFQVLKIPLTKETLDITLPLWGSMKLQLLVTLVPASSLQPPVISILDA